MRLLTTLFKGTVFIFPSLAEVYNLDVNLPTFGTNKNLNIVLELCLVKSPHVVNVIHEWWPSC